MAQRRFSAALVLGVLCALCVGVSPTYAAGNPPVAFDDSMFVTLDEPASVFLDAFDDEDDPLTFSVVSGPSHGALTDDCSDGECTYTPNAGFTGGDSFTWKANDGTSDSDLATMSIQVDDPNALEAFDVGATVEDGSAVDIELSGFDPGGGDLGFQIVTPPAHGTLGAIGTPACDTGSCTATVTYASTQTAASDAFTYRVSNSATQSAPATVTLQITPSTGAHIITSGPLTNIGISPVLNCSVRHTGDASGEFYSDTACGTFVALGGTVYGPASVPAGGVGQTAYTPVSQSKSGAGTAASPFEIHTVVTLVPGVTLDQVDSYVVGQESYRTAATLVNSTGAPISAVIYKAADCYLQDSDSGYGRYDAATGAIACVGVGDNGPSSRIEQFLPLSPGSSYYESTYSSVWHAVGTGTPLPNLCEQCSAAVDNGAGLSWSVSVPAGGSVSRSHLTTFSPLGISPLSTTKTADSSSAVGGHADGYTITVTNPNTTAATLTSITDDLPAGFSYTAGSTSGVTSSNPTVNGQQLTWSGSFTVPPSGQVSLHFGVVVSTTPGTYVNNAGGTAVDLAVVPTGSTAPVTVTANHAPTAVTDTITTAQDTPSAATNVVANDTDADGDTLSVTGKTNGAHGTVTCTTTSCTYTPAAGFSGSDSFTYTVSDGFGGTATGTVTVTVTPVGVNHPPVANADTITTAEDTASAATNVVANDTDVDGDTLTLTGKTNGAHGTVSCTTTSCTYTPAADYNGPDSFTYTVSDGHGGTDTGTVSVTVTPVNDNPHAVADAITTAEDTPSAATNVVANDTDVDGDALTVTGKTNGAHGTVACTATSCTYTPAADYNGPDSFTYTVSDGHGGTDTGTVSVTVTPVNDNPHAVADAITTAEDTASAATNVVTNDTDVDGDTLTLTGKTNGAHGTVACTTTSCTYTPAADYNGPDSFTYTVSDGHGGADTGTVSVTVTPVNDNPHAVADAITTAEDTPSAATNVVANDTDVDGDALTVTGKTNGAHGTVACTATSCTYTPAADYNGPDSFTYTVSDGHGGTDTGTVSVTVTPVNDNPHAVADAITTAEDTPSAATNVVANDTDVDGDSLTVTGKTNGAHGTVACTTTSCTYTPAAGFSGSDSFTYTVSDGHGGADTGTVSVTVTPAVANHPPVANADTITTSQDTPSAAKNVVANDTDADGDNLTVTGKTNGAHGTVTCTTTSCTYTPAAGFSGSDSFTYTISDGHGGTATGTVAVTVTPTGRADVSVTKTALVGKVKVGALGGYRLQVTNTGTVGSGTVVLTDKLPSAFVLRATTGGSCSVQTGTLTCTISSLAPGQRMTIEVSGAFTKHGRITNTATVTASGDSNHANDTAGVTVTVKGSSCTIVGTFGDDDLRGTRHHDVICGLAGDDHIEGGGADDVLYGNEGDDVLLGGDAADKIDGGPGNDTASYAGSSHGVHCDLSRSRATGEGTDKLIDIENLIGSRYDDTLIGDDGANNLSGGRGNDTLIGKGGRDHAHQGPGHGTVRP